MDEFKKLLMISACLANPAWAGPALDQAEVRVPYGELKTLVEGAARQSREPGPRSALSGARFRLSVSGGKPVLNAVFRTLSFSDELTLVPLVGGDVSIVDLKPETAGVLIHEGMLCHALAGQGQGVLESNLACSFSTDGMNLVMPECPAAVFETGDLGEEQSVSLKIDGRERVLSSNASVALPLAGGTVKLKMLGGEEAREALRPPEPSVWIWQHQALVIPGNGEITYRVLARASASVGSGVAAQLTLPADAREVRVTGADLSGHKITRREDRTQGLQMEWKTRGLLEREVSIFYQLPRRPLDRTWKLQSPVSDGQGEVETRFFIVGSPDLAYAAEGLAGPFAPKSLPRTLVEDLKGVACYQMEAGASAELSVNPLPVVATAEATVNDAQWAVKLEPDGAMLVEGALAVEHQGMLGMIVDVPAGMTLLSCQVGGKPVAPVNRGEGKLEINLPVADGKSMVSCSFTGRAAAFDPMAGTLELSLPKTPLFIRAITWKIDLPRGYEAETHGNLARVTAVGDPSSRITLRKNLCRDERPQINVFYQRSDLNL